MAETTTDHETIRRWTEERGGRPSVVRSTHGSKGSTGIIRIEFPGAPQSKHDNLEEISWAEFFEQMKPWLMGEGAHGDQASVAASCRMSAAALKMALHRLKKRFRQCVKLEVTGTLDDPAMVEAEMQSLFSALGG